MRKKKWDLKIPDSPETVEVSGILPKKKKKSCKNIDSLCFSRKKRKKEMVSLKMTAIRPRKTEWHKEIFQEGSMRKMRQIKDYKISSVRQKIF